jgi:hypothetical protein
MKVEISVTEVLQRLLGQGFLFAVEIERAMPSDPVARSERARQILSELEEVLRPMVLEEE